MGANGVHVILTMCFSAALDSDCGEDEAPGSPGNPGPGSLRSDEDAADFSEASEALVLSPPPVQSFATTQEGSVVRGNAQCSFV